MVDFSLTKTDEMLVAMAREESEIARGYARYYDQNEHELIAEDHPAVAGRERPIDALHRLAEETSGVPITEVLMKMQGTTDVSLRHNPNGLGTMIIGYAGSEEQRQRFNGKNGYSIAMTEPGAGSDPSRITGTARFDVAANQWVLNGEKIYCTGFGTADGAVVMLRGEAVDGVRPFLAFVVEKGTPGLTELGQVQKMGIRAMDTADFVMEDVRVPPINQLDSNFGRTMVVFNGTRPLIAAGALGICRSILDFTQEQLAKTGHALDYAKGAAGRSAIEDRLIELEALWEAAALTVLRTKWLELGVGASSGLTKVEAAMAKALGGQAARDITQGCIELLGPEGLSEEHLAEKWFRDARIYDIYEGAGEINRLIIARALFGYSNKQLN